MLLNKMGAWLWVTIPQTLTAHIKRKHKNRTYLPSHSSIHTAVYSFQGMMIDRHITKTFINSVIPCKKKKKRDLVSSKFYKIIGIGSFFLT